MQNIDRLEETIRAIRKRFGDHTVTTLSAYKTAQTLPSGFPMLDDLLGCGGIPRGRVTAFCGRASSGRGTLVQHITAHLQRDLDVTAYLDLSGTFDGESAARCGIAQERLLVIRPEQPRLLPELIGTLIGLHVELIVLDASAALKFVLLPDWLASEIARGRSAVLSLHPFGQTPKLDHAAVRLLVERIETPANGAEVTDWQVRVTVLASRFTPPGGQVLIDLPLEDV